MFPTSWGALVDRAVALARAGAEARPGSRVAGSIAPLEDCYRPDLSPAPDDPDGCRSEHRALAERLAAAGCDLLLCETFPRVDEALLAAEAALATGLPTWVSFTPGPDLDLLRPAQVAEGARRAVGLGAAAVLVNCVPARGALDFVEAIAGALAAEGAQLPHGCYANAGHVDDRMGWTSSPGAPERYVETAELWVRAGATLLGGCCGTGVPHVRALAQRVRRLGARRRARALRASGWRRAGADRAPQSGIGLDRPLPSPPALLTAMRSSPLPQRLARAGLFALISCLPLASCGGGGGESGDGGGGAVSVSSILPASGVLQGGFFATLRGSGFAAGGTTEVFFGSTPATNVTVVDGSTLTCRVPAATSEGAVSVRVSNAAGSGSLGGGFRYARLEVPDFNDDGIPDLAVGATGHGAGDLGAAYIFFRDPIGLADTQGGEAGLKIIGPAAASDFGHRLAAGDLNDDGIFDLAISAPRYGTGGAVFVFFGPLSPGSSIAAGAASAILTSEALAPGDFFGESLALGDVSGDGVDDVVVGAIHHDFPTLDNGAVYAFFGGSGFSHTPATNADAKLTGRAPGNQFGKDLAIADVSADGRDDIVIGSPFGGQVRGELSVFYGGDTLVSGTADQADIQVTGEADSRPLRGRRDHRGTSTPTGSRTLVAGAPRQRCPRQLQRRDVRLLRRPGAPHPGRGRRRDPPGVGRGRRLRARPGGRRRRRGRGRRPRGRCSASRRGGQQQRARVHVPRTPQLRRRRSRTAPT